MFNSLRFKILVFQLFLLLLVALSLGVFSYFFMAVYLKEVQEEIQNYIVKHVAIDIRNSLSNRCITFERVTLSQEFKSYHENSRDRALIEDFTKYKVQLPELSYVNKEGREEIKVINGKQSEEYSDYGNSSFFKDAIAAPNKVIISSEEFSQELGVPVIRFALAKYSYFGDKFIGLCLGTVPLPDICDIKKTKIGKNGFICVINQEGKILSSSYKNSKLLSNIATEGEKAKQLITNATALKSGFSRATILGVDSFISYYPVKGRKWVVIAALPYKEFMVAPNTLINISFGIFLFIFFIGLYLSIILGNNIANPLSKLSEIANAVAMGDLSQKVNIKSSKEIKLLGDAFNKIIDNSKGIVKQAKQVAQGQYIVGIKPRSKNDSLSLALIQMTKALGARLILRAYIS